MDPRLRPYLEDQWGVVSRRQAREAGLDPHDLARLVRRRELARIHPGVYLDHTGEPTFLQRAWAGVQLYWPAALGHETALRAIEGPSSRRPERPIHLVVARDRKLSPPAGLVVHRSAHLAERVQWHTGPPRLRYEEAALDVAADASSDFAALGEISRAIQSRRTTAARMRDRVQQRPGLPRRQWMQSVLADVAAGTCSVLEHGYLHRVERAHGLTGARRQVRDRLAAGTVFRDVVYRCGLVVELDGRLFHDSTAQRDRDYDRDLETAVGRLQTVRLSYGQVFDRPCWTTRHLVALLRLHGWDGSPRPCGPACRIR